MNPIHGVDDQSALEWHIESYLLDLDSLSDIPADFQDNR